MVSYQDIKEFEERISEALLDYLEVPEAYETPYLYIYLDECTRSYQAEVIDEAGAELDGYYEVEKFLDREENAPNMDEVSRLANSYMFLGEPEGDPSVMTDMQVAERLDDAAISRVFFDRGLWNDEDLFTMFPVETIIEQLKTKGYEVCKRSE